jgi:Tol biopolymer transport system component
MTMRKSLLVAVLSCALAVALLPAPAAVPQPAANGSIAFTSGRGGAFEIWGVDDPGDATASIVVTGGPGSLEADPAWDPDGDGDLAFARRAPEDETFDLFVKPASTTAVRLTDEEEGAAHDRQPDWSVTGVIAFTRSIRANDTTHLYTVPAGGGAPVRLTGTPAPGYDAGPAWSPTGAQIAFVSDRTGTPQLWTMNADGSAQLQRTSDPCFVSNPDWSPLGTRIVYERQCPGQRADLYALDTTTWMSTAVVSDPAGDHQPVYSPAGNQVAFTRIEADGDKELYVVPDGGGPAAPFAGNDAEQADLTADWGSQSVTSAGGFAAHPRLQAGRDLSASREMGKPNGRRRFRRVVKGVRFIEMRKARSDVYALKVDSRRIPRVDVALSNDLLPGHEKTRRMARRHRAVAGINGDFGTPSGRPSHTFAEDGDLKQVSFAVAPTFSMTADEQQTVFARPVETVTASEQDSWPVARWNFGAPPYTDISAFTPAGGRLESPPANACAARLLPVGGRRWAPGNTGVEVDYAVNEVGCSTVPMGVNGGVVLAARPGSDGAILIDSLTPGETITLAWSLGFADVLDTVGGTPLLVENGAVVATACPQSICKKHPRTAIGATPAGRILMVVVDGRRKDSKGVTLVRLARLMQSLGASFALNLDGGGSSTMVVKGKKGGLRVVNQPSDGRQRKVSSAVLVIKGRDPGEAIGAPIPRAPADGAPSPGPGEAGRLAVLDAASTGGLLEAMAEGSFGPPVDLPPPLRRALHTFRSSE